MPSGAAAGLGAALVAALVVVAAGDAAAATPIALTWSAPPECPQVDAVQGWVLGYLGAADPAGYSDVRVRGEVGRAVAGWRLRLVFERDGVTGERSFEGSDCEELARSAALALAIALVPNVGVVPPPSSGMDPGPEAETVPEPPVVPTPPEPGETAIVRRPVAPPTVRETSSPASFVRAGAPGVRVAHALRVSGGVEAGLLPGVGGGVTAGYVLRLPWLRLELIGGFWPGRRRAYADRPDVGASAALGIVGLRLCPTLRLRPAHDGRGGPGLVELPLCAGLELGALAVRGRGFADARALTRPWLALEVQPAISWRFARHLALWAGVAVVVPLRRPSFQVDPLPALWQVGGVGVRTLVGLEWQPGRDPAHKK